MTNKRNTLLYLDKDLVNESKRAGLNLSLVAEEALRSRLPYYGRFRPETHLMRALKEGSAAILPMRIEELSITDVNGMNNKTLRLKDLNMIAGGNGAGKSRIFRLLCRAFRISQSNGLAYHSREKIVVTIAPTRRIEYSEDKGDSDMAWNKQCLIADALFTPLDKEARSKMLKHLIKTGAQLILLETEMISGTEKFNIIGL